MDFPFGTEVRSFYSLQELRQLVEEEITQYKSMVEEYSQWLGLFLRDSETANKDQEWFKNISAMQKSLKAGKKPPSKEKKPNKKQGVASDWIPFKEVMLCATESGEAEVLFEAIEEIHAKIDKLTKVKSALEELEKSGLGKGITYVVFILDGVPEKIALRQKKEDSTERFKFATEFSVSTES